MQSLHCLKSQPPSCLPKSNIKLATSQSSHISTNVCIHSCMNAARKRMALWLTGNSCEWPDRCVQKRRKDSSALRGNESPIESNSLFFKKKFKPDSIHVTGGRLRARVPRGLGGEAALDVKQRWSLWVVLFFFSCCWRRRRGCWTCSSVRRRRRRRGGCREAQLSRRPVRDCFIVPTVQFSEGQIWYSPPRRGVFPFQAPAFFFFSFFFTLFCPGTTQKDSLPPRLAESRDVI